MKTILYAVCVVLLIAVTPMMAEDAKATKKSGKASITFVPDVHKKPQGYFTLSGDGKRVYIQSFDGTIKLTFPRTWYGRFSALSKAQQEAELKEDDERIWPIDNPAFTSEFLEWVGRAMHVSEAGVVPDKL
jgi:hypothetical protein